MKHPNRILLPTLSISVLAAICPVARAQQGDGTDVPITAHIFKPDKVPATPERVAQIKAPPGFKVTVFASGLKNARILAVAPSGDVYVSRRDQGDVLLLKDGDGDGRADGEPIPVAHRSGAHGIAIHDGKLYLVTVKEVFVADIQPDGRLGPLSMIIGDLPDSGQHPNRTLAFGPDGMLYLSAGSTCNACNESNPENATLMRATPDGKSRSIFASGLRNTIGYDWNPKTGELWGMDQGIDFLGDEVTPEELNRIERGKQYGWPHVWGAGGINPQSTPPGDITKEQWKAMSTPMTLGYTAHAAAMQLVFYRGGSFPAEYDGDAFVTFRGSWNRQPASGYEIVRIRFKDGQPQGFEPFVSGFLTDGGRTHIARPVGLVVAKDGALLMSDDANGTIYRIAYQGTSAGMTSKVDAPAEAMKRQAARGTNVPLAKDREETQLSADRSRTQSADGGDGRGTLKVTSPAIEPDAIMPIKYTAYADNVSPELAWNAVPNAASYAVVLEDPDASPARPFVHWVIWNIPGTMTRLPEGVQAQMRLTDPEGVLQGRTTRGSPGYFGPKTPVGDSPHHYHFQVFALDAKLDLPPGADRDQVLAAAKGHVIAKGELVGRYQQLVKPPK